MRPRAPSEAQATRQVRLHCAPRAIRVVCIDNDEPRIVALTKECRAPVTELRKGKQPEDYLLRRENGEPVRDLRGTWDALVTAAGLPGLLLHDFRRSAVRNMVRRGIAERVAMKISGHKTRSVFRAL